MATQLRSFSKINLGLAVGPVRPDGYHALTTIYQTLELHDRLTVRAVRAAKTTLELHADHPGVPCTAKGNAERNTIHRMLALALAELGIMAEVTVHLQKRLPVQGGLGAGSANAATALLGLERELGVALPGPARLRLAAAVGSDVPLFLIGGTVLGLGRGEAVSPLPEAASLPVVIAVPRVGISTARAFADLDAAMALEQPTASSLTSHPAHDRLNKLSRVFSSVWATTGVERTHTGIVTNLPASEQKPAVRRDDLARNPLLALVRTGIENDFESAAFRQHPSLREIKRTLEGSSEPGSRALFAGLSGSGSALFGIYSEIAAAREAQQRVKSLGIDARLTRTLSREGYFDQIFA